MQIAAVLTLFPDLRETEVLTWVERGWVRPARAGEEWTFEEIDIARVRLLHDLRYDMAVAEETMPLVLSLLAGRAAFLEELVKVAGARGKAYTFPMSGAEVFAKACKDEGVGALFCCPGNYTVVHALASAGIPAFGGRHEGSMAHAADAFIRRFPPCQGEYRLANNALTVAMYDAMVEALVAARENADDAAVSPMATGSIAVSEQAYTDGGMHPVFVEKLRPQQIVDERGLPHRVQAPQPTRPGNP